MAIKVWSVKNPVFSGVLLISALSQAAEAAELRTIQPAAAPGIDTPDQVVRQMARNMVSSSRAANVPTNSMSSAGFGRIVPSNKVSALPITNKQVIPSSISVASNFATQPPVDLGTSSARGIAKTEQNKFTDSVRNTTPLNQASIDAPRSQALTATPNDQIAKAAIMSLSVEPGFSKDIAFGQPVKAVSPVVAVNKIAPAVTSTSIISEDANSEGSTRVSGFQDQFSSFTGQLVANSWKMMGVLPKPQLDSSLLNIHSSGFTKPTDSSFFNSRFTLGSSVAMVSPEVFNSLKTEPSIISGGSKNAKSISADPFPLNKSNFLAQPFGGSGSKLIFGTPNSFSAPNALEVSTNPFNIVNFPTTVNNLKLSTDKFGK